MPWISELSPFLEYNDYCLDQIAWRLSRLYLESVNTELGQYYPNLLLQTIRDILALYHKPDRLDEFSEWIASGLELWAIAQHLQLHSVILPIWIEFSGSSPPQNPEELWWQWTYMPNLQGPTAARFRGAFQNMYYCAEHDYLAAHAPSSEPAEIPDLMELKRRVFRLINQYYEI